jgi:hypothetical protein
MLYPPRALVQAGSIFTHLKMNSQYLLASSHKSADSFDRS